MTSLARPVDGAIFVPCLDITAQIGQAPDGSRYLQMYATVT